LDFQGDGFFYRGDFKSARSLYEQASRAAANSKEPDKILIAKTDMAKVDVQDGHGKAAINSLRLLVEQAEKLGLKYIAVECSLLMAEDMIQNHDYAQAQQELERALLGSDKLGVKPLSAKAHFLLGTVARQTSHSGEAEDNYRGAIQLLDGMSKEPGADKILQRSDFKAIYDESSRWSAKS
jgi:tetratricopeptide (TPR) repeat protein